MNLSSVVTKLQTVNESLRDLSDNYGESLQDFRGKLENENEYLGEKLLYVVNYNSLMNEKRRLVQTVTDCIHSRLKNIDSDALFLSCHAFDPKNWPDI